MSTTTIPPFGRGSLAVGTGRRFHIHLLGAAILREQLHDGDVMIETATNAKVVRMRTELQTPPSRPAPPTIPTPREPEPETSDVRMVFPVIDERTVRLIRGTVQTARHTR